MTEQAPTLADKYPPTPPCSCEVCRAFCRRPGWWTVEEAARAISAGCGHRMMLELAPDRSFGVLSPAFGGCEAFFAVQEYAGRGCNFYKGERCELHGTGLQPLECRVCHHAQPGTGPACHADIERDWNSPEGRALVSGWCKLTGVWEFLDAYGLSQLKA